MLSRLRALPFYYAKVRGRDTMSLGNRCDFYSRRDVYRTSDLSCKGSIHNTDPYGANKTQIVSSCQDLRAYHATYVVHKYSTIV